MPIWSKWLTHVEKLPEASLWPISSCPGQSKNTKLSGEVAAALEDYGLPLFKSGTSQRVVYPTTASEGRTVLADFPDEIEAIKDELKEVLQC